MLVSECWSSLKNNMSLNKNLFKLYPNRVLVETGSYRGDALRYALAAGFERIISIDISQQQIDFCYKRFDLNNSERPIELICGDSAECLWDAIKDIDEPITFWLDSHWQMLEGETPGENPFPLIDELLQIADHPIKTHTIMIDDMLIMQNDITGYNKKDIESLLLSINPKYKLTYHANPVINGILVAHL